jgi:hypothetical protein
LFSRTTPTLGSDRKLKSNSFYMSHNQSTPSERKIMNPVIKNLSASKTTTQRARYGLLLALMTGLLAACGGGGGSSAATAPTSSGGGGSGSGGSTNGGTVQGVQMPSNVAVVTAQNAG